MFATDFWIIVFIFNKVIGLNFSEALRIHGKKEVGLNFSQTLRILVKKQ